VYGKHFNQFTSQEWKDAQELIALKLWEQDQQDGGGDGDDDGDAFEDALAGMMG
jgi:hypothetical protein